MGWKNRISKFSGKMTKEKWLLLLLVGVFLMILSFPLPGGMKQGKEAETQVAQEEGQGAVPLWTGEDSVGDSAQNHGDTSEASGDGGAAFPASTSAKGNESYEVQLENRIRDLLKSVEGVGKVDVMVVLKSSGEKVLRVDRSLTSNTTQEKDSGGGTRDVTSSQSQESTVLSGNSGGGSGNGPVVQKELSPEISGIIISAEGGGSPQVKAEISEAMEALFGLPAHKIKVLKRVE